MADTERGSLHWDTYADSFAHRLATIRRAREMSQEELAHRAGIHRNAVSNLERGVGNHQPFVADPRLSTVYRLAKALRVAPVLLLPDAEAPLRPRSAEQASRSALSEVESQLFALLGVDPETLPPAVLTRVTVTSAPLGTT
jgi:transcriptional regulator with XRE-family HTH domain